jgi:integrase
MKITDRNTTAIETLALRTVEALQAYGLEPYSAWENYSGTYLPIIKMHIGRSQAEFDRGIVTEYVRQVEGRYERKEIQYQYYRNLIRAAQRLTEMHDTGKISWTAPKRKSGFKLNDYYEKILDGFVSGGSFSPKGRSDATWIGRKYFAWLIQDGHPFLDGVGADEVQRFIVFCSRHMKASGIHNVKLYMKKLYKHLVEKQYSGNDYKGLLSFPVSRESRLFPALPNTEIAEIIELIDRRTPKGKRDYAIMLLGVVVGLRAIDVARMRLSDIDWKKGEIKIVQAKTNESAALPLTKDVGEAIQDYILHGRQQTTSDAVFLRIHAPFQGFSNGVAVGYLYDYYRKRAGLPRDAYDGKGFHALRRTLGRNLTASGIPVTMTAQIFGDTHIDSTTKYISLDSEHLKECALDFIGIEPKGGDCDE